MDIQTFIKDIQVQICGQSYEDCVPVFQEYKAYLEQRKRDRDGTVAVTCQLAAIYFELRYGTAKSIQMLEALLADMAEQLTSIEKGRIYTNLAFYYEDDDDKENCIRCLKAAVSLCPAVSPNAYDALGRLCIENGQSKSGISFLKKACSLSKRATHQYNYGVGLFSSGDIVSAKELFWNLLPNSGDERRIPYAYGICCALRGEIENARKIADQLAINVSDDYIASSEVADLYFLCGEYAKHNKMYDNGCYAISVDWIAPYFYSLKILGNFDQLAKKYVDFIFKADCAIEEALAEKLDTSYTQQDKLKFIEIRKSEKDELVQAYHMIINTNYKPQLRVKLWCITECYLLDCPRHQAIDSNLKKDIDLLW